MSGEAHVDRFPVPCDAGTSSIHVAGSAWSHVVTGETHSRGLSLNVVTPVVPQTPLVSGDGSSLSANTMATRSEGGPDLVVGRGTPGGWDSSELLSHRHVWFWLHLCWSGVLTSMINSCQKPGPRRRYKITSVFLS